MVAARTELSEVEAGERAEVAAALGLVVARLGRRLRQQAEGDLTPTLRSALAAVDHHGPVRLGELARHEGVSAPTMSKVVDRLEELGLARRGEDPADARTTVVAATGKGRRTLATLRTKRTAYLSRRLAGCPDADLDALRAALPVLESLLDEAP